MTVVATPSEGRNSRQILILMEIQISVNKNTSLESTQIQFRTFLFSRMIPASVQLLEFCLLTENSDVCNSQFCPKANQPTFPPTKQAIIITAFISVAPHLINVGEHATLYKTNKNVSIKTHTHIGARKTCNEECRRVSGGGGK